LDASRFLFTDLTDAARSVKPSYYFMMRSLLHSRIDTGLPSHPGGEEEDVNVYLAHLLQAFGDSTYFESSRPYLHRYDHEVFDRLSQSTDARLKYKIYKTNADFLLISIGIFDNPSQTLLGQGHGPAAAHRAVFEPSEEATIGRGRTYYQFAFEYSQVVNRKHPAVTEVLEKLSHGFDRYAQILAHLRGEYLDLIQQFSQGEIYHLERSVNREQLREKLQERQDAFLDAYAVWRRSGTEQDRKSMHAAADALRELDPNFTFDPDAGPGDSPAIEGGDPPDEP
jgi:hypothetical protein